MSDRKYRQRGYQDDDRDRPRAQTKKPEPEPGAPAGTRRISQDGPKNINMPGFRQVVRCSQCGNANQACCAGVCNGNLRCTGAGGSFGTCRP